MAERTRFTFGDGSQPSTDGADGSTYVTGAVDFGDTGGDRGDSTGGGGGSGDDREFDPDRHISRTNINADGTFRRKRRRRGSGSGTTSRTSSAYNSASVDALTQTLIIVHAGLASVTKIKEFAIDQSEGKALATALANVLAEFDIPIDRKTQAMVGLVVAGASTYGPRLYLYNERMKEQKNGPKVVPIRPAHLSEVTPMVDPDAFVFPG